MAIFKCKMCGGTLEVRENESVCVCDFCGTQQTIATTQDEALQGLFNRANILRMKSEFDKAESLYEKIIQTKPDEAEAYWGLILCRYGIEYVEDPKTFKRIPTCHRTSFDSVIADPDYKAALQYADLAQRAIYEAEAKEIDRLQKEILALSQKEDPYDVFICYKETDESGRRTPDSVIANDIYHQLTQEGFKVFYAAISLENKLGSAYEPCIFAALNSAKVMLVVGTKPEYFNAVWVKNEWSRYLKLMKTDRSRILIPCYRDMDAYELPEEFAHLQAQDMSKIGFINDLVRGIRKVLRRDTSAAQSAAAPVSANASTAQPMIDRGYMALEDREWNKADEFFEQALNLDAKNGDAYLGKFLVSVKHSSFQSFLNERTDRTYIDRTQSKPQKAAFRPKEESLKQMAAHFAVPGYLEEEALLQELSGFDPNFASEFDQMERHISSCHLRMDTNKDLQRARQYGSPEISRQADALFETLNGMLAQAKQTDENTVAEKRKAYEQFVREFQSSAAQRSAEAKRQADADATAKEHELNEKYQAATVLAAKADSPLSYDKAIKAFQIIPDYKDSKAQIKTLQERRDRVATQIEKERARKAKKITLISIASIVAVAVLAVLTVTVFIPMTKYNAAKDLYNNGQFDEAIAAFEAMDGFFNSEKMIEQCERGITDKAYLKAKSLLESGEYEDAKAAFKKLDDYKDSKELIAKCNEAINADRYAKAKELYKSGKYEKALSIFKQLGSYKDSEKQTSLCENKIAESEYAKALDYLHDGASFTAHMLFLRLGDYKDSKKQADKCWNPSFYHETVSTGLSHTVGLKKNGTVVAVGDNEYGQCDVSDWRNIVAVSAGGKNTVGLKKDGTVVAVGHNLYGQCDVSDWKDIVAICAGNYCTIGLKKDGTVVAVGNKSDGQCDVSDWKDIVAIGSDLNHTVGLKKDGTVVATGRFVGKYKYGDIIVSGWKDIVAISSGSGHIVGLKKDGTVVATGINDAGECNVSDWRDIIAISAGWNHTVGLKKDGSVVAVGEHINDLSNWKDITAISAEKYHSVGLKKDGTVVAFGSNDSGQCNVSAWKNIKLP